MEETAEIEISTKHENSQLDEPNMRKSPKKSATKTRKRPKNNQSNIRKTPEINVPTMLESTVNDMSLSVEEKNVNPDNPETSPEIMNNDNPETSPEKTLSLTPENPEKSPEKTSMMPEIAEIDVRIQESPENSVSMKQESPENNVNTPMPACPESEILKMLGTAITTSMMVTPDMLDNPDDDKAKDEERRRKRRQKEFSPSISIYSDVSGDEVPTPPQRYKRKVQHYLFIYPQFKSRNAICLILGTSHVLKFPANKRSMG